MRLVSAAEMREIDRIAIASFGIPGLTLMEKAGRAVAEAAAQLDGAAGRIVVVCGAGNNGGDGFAAARLLRAVGRNVQCIALVPGDRLPADARSMREQAQRAGVSIADQHQNPSFQAGAGDVVVDALLGTGVTRAPEGAFAAAIACVNQAGQNGAKVLAVDLPSGLSSDSGLPLGPCVKADRTVTFGFLKRGLVLHPGAELCGELTIADIGIPAAASDRVPGTCELLTDANARALVPVRPADMHKGDAGHVLVVAGSPGKTGAANLCLGGALRGGAGLVTLATRAEALGAALEGRPEAMSEPLRGTGPLKLADLEGLVAAAKAANALVMGPGIPRGGETGELIRRFLEASKIPAVLDADALNALAGAPALAALATLPSPVILTPHPGEMARLLGIAVAQVQADRIGQATRAAKQWRATVILKGARTIVADPEGTSAVIPTGNPGMATGGTGDVLAGLVGALLAGGLAPGAAARAGAFVHGRAGDLAARGFGQRGLLAGDLARAIGAVWAEWGR